MRQFLKRLVGYPEFAPPKAAAAASMEMRGNPIVMNPSRSQRVLQVEYRIGAIERYFAQEGERGKPIAADKRAHLEAELIVKRAELTMLRAGE